MNYNNKHIAIIGLGLMGGSLALALKKRFKRITIHGVSRNKVKIRSAIKNKIIDCGTCELHRLLTSEKIDIIFIATPVKVVTSFISSIEKHVRYKVIVSDLGSTKSEIMRWVDRHKFKFIQFVGSHPMAGSHQSGIDAAQNDLYDNSLCFVIKTKKTPKGAFAVISRLWKALGMQTVTVKPDVHDKIVAKVSHLPHAVASMLAGTILQNNPAIIKFAGPGFFDTTRIAQSAPSLWVDIFLSNQKNVIFELNRFRKNIDSFISIIKKKDAKKLESFLNKAYMQRKKDNLFYDYCN